MGVYLPPDAPRSGIGLSTTLGGNKPASFSLLRTSSQTSHFSLTFLSLSSFSFSSLCFFIRSSRLEISSRRAVSASACFDRSRARARWISAYRRSALEAGTGAGAGAGPAAAEVGAGLEAELGVGVIASTGGEASALDPIDGLDKLCSDERERDAHPSYGLVGAMGGLVISNPAEPGVEVLIGGLFNWEAAFGDETVGAPTALGIGGSPRS